MPTSKLFNPLISDYGFNTLHAFSINDCPLFLNIQNPDLRYQRSEERYNWAVYRR